MPAGGVGALALLNPIMLMQLGLLVGITELIVALTAFWRAGKLGLDWLKLFGLGVLLLSLAQILCKVIGRGILHLPFTYPIGVPFKTAGLILVLYSLLRAIDHPKTKILILLGLGAGAYFFIGSMIAFTMRFAFEWWTFHIPHILFLVAGPLIIGYYIFEAYRETGDKSALFFSLGLWIYGIASLIVIVGIQIVHIETALAYTLIARAIAMIIVLLGTV